MTTRLLTRWERFRRWLGWGYIKPGVEQVSDEDAP